MRLQLSQVRLGEEIIICENCNRILYYVPAEQPQQTTAQTANSGAQNL